MTDHSLDAVRYPVGRFTVVKDSTAAMRAKWIDEIAAAPDILAGLVAGMTPAQMQTPYREGGWTAAQVVNHVADSHVNAYIRTKFTLAEDGFTVKPYEESRWAQFPDALALDVTPSLNMLRGLHARWTALLRTLGDWLIREDTPLTNPFWEYARNKIACEERLLRALREDGFPVTIVRPSLTYGDTQVPLAVNSWDRPFTAIARMRRGAPLIVPGDGTSLWTITHNSDFARGFVGLLGRRQAIGHAFNIMFDEVLTWDEIYRQVATAAGVEAQIVHIASDFIAACMPEMRGTLLGDKSVSAVFDTTKIKRFVPDFRPSTPFSEGIRRTVAWFDADPARQQVDAAMAARWDRLVAAYEQGLANAIAEVREGT